VWESRVGRRGGLGGVGRPCCVGLLAGRAPRVVLSQRPRGLGTARSLLSSPLPPLKVFPLFNMVLLLCSAWFALCPRRSGPSHRSCFTRSRPKTLFPGEQARLASVRVSNTNYSIDADRAVRGKVERLGRRRAANPAAQGISRTAARRRGRGDGMDGLLRALLPVSRGIDAFNARIGKRLSWLVLAAVVVSATNAVVRKVFDTSSNSWLELQ